MAASIIAGLRVHILSVRSGGVWCMLVGLGVLAACGEEPSGPNQSPVATVEVSPAVATPLVGQTVQLTATPKTAAGIAITGKTIIWSSSAETVASVSASGLLTGVTVGQAIITASAGGMSGNVTVLVTTAQASSCTDCLEVVPGTLLLNGVGSKQQLISVQVDAAGNRTAVAATFESSNPSVVTVTATGLVTAAADLGSAQLTARAGNLTSAPVLALVAQPAAGALLVSDGQIEGAITPVDSAAVYKPGYQYRVRLRGAAPAVGQVVLGTGARPVGGRVVSVTDAGPGLKDVVLELLPISGMFAAILVNEQIPLDQAAGVVSPAVMQAFSVQRLPGGSLRYTSRGGRMVPTNVRVLPRTSGSASNLNEIEFKLGPFSCEAKVTAGGLSFPVILDASSFTIAPDLTFDVVITSGGVKRAVAHGDITVTVSSKLLVDAAVTGSLECKKEVKRLSLPIHGLAGLFIGGHIPISVGFALEAKAELAGIGYDAFLQSTMSASFGVDCAGACKIVGDVSSNSDGFFKPRLPASFNELRTELTASAFGLAELKLGNPDDEKRQFKVLEVRAGLEQKAELASERGQADDSTYASSFKLSPVLRAEASLGINALGGLLSVQFAAFSFAPELPTLARSPVGTFTISPATVAPGDDTKLGGMATFQVVLDPVTYLTRYAVEAVEILWLKKDSTGKLVLVPGRPGCNTLRPEEDLQTHFICQTDFVAADTGVQTFYAFVKAKLFEITVPLLLEIGKNAVATVRVGTAPPVANVTTYLADVSITGTPLCTVSRSETGASGSVSVSIPLFTCTGAGSTWQLQSSISGAPNSGTLTGSVSRASLPTSGRGRATQTVIIRDTLLIDAPGQTGALLQFVGGIAFGGSLSVTGNCSSEFVSIRMPFITNTLKGCDSVDLEPNSSFAHITYRVGSPFPFTLFIQVESSSGPSFPSGSSTGGSVRHSITYRWTGMSQLPPGATVTSSSGIDWTKPGPVPVPVP